MRHIKYDIISTVLLCTCISFAFAQETTETPSETIAEQPNEAIVESEETQPQAPAERVDRSFQTQKTTTVPEETTRTAVEQAAPKAVSETPVQAITTESTSKTALPKITNVSQTVSNKISLDIKGMDIVDILKILSNRAGMNLVIGKNVTGKVTLFLKDVDIWDAFEIILLANDLAYERKGDIVNVITQRDYELKYGDRYKDKKEVKIMQLKFAKVAEMAKSLTQIKSNIGKVVADESSNTVVLIDIPDKIKEMSKFIEQADLVTETRVFSLNYGLADKISAKLKEAITKGVGTINVDERTNKIIITDYPGKLDEVAEIIAAFDEKTPQVLIDAQIIEIKPSDKFEMGVNWDYWIKQYFDVKASLPINTSNALILGTPNVDPSKPGKYKAIIDILRTIGETNVLSSPRIMALNNQEAKIHVGSKEAYITSTTSQGGSGNTVTSQTVNFVDTGILLNVTPTINRDGFVTMKIRPEISDATSKDILSGDQKTTVPIVSSSDAETTVMVKDGVTIIIGGLRKDKQERTEKRIPILGDLPGIGYLFRSTTNNLTKSDLVILLTPHIMTGETSYTAFSQIKPKEGAVVDMRSDGRMFYEDTTLADKKRNNKISHYLGQKNTD
ncbi:MAG: secretin N-terminal domain-containing protein [Candidatus Omnitrophota bacterium]